MYNLSRIQKYGVIMRNKKNLGLLVAIMMLSISNINIPAFSADKSEPVENQSVETEEIKVNRETLEKASNAIANKDYQSAIVYLTAYINNRPKKYEAYKMRGEAFYALRQYRLAQADFQKAIELKSSDDKFITGTKVLGAVVLGADKQDQYQNPELGNLYGKLMYAQKALNNPAYESTFQKAFQYNSHIYLPQPKKDDIAKINCPQKYGKVLNPQGIDSYIYGAISDIEKGNFNEAAYKTQYITSNYPKYYLGYYLTGVAMSGLEQEQDAIVAFEAALKANPYDFESFASLGQVYYSEAEKTFSKDAALKSIEYFNKALKYNPNCYIYHFYIGLNQLQLGDYDKAIVSFDSAIKLKTNDYNSMYYKLIAQQLKGDYNAVVDGATKLLYRHVSNYNSVLYLRALAYFKSGNSDAAVADLEKIHNNMNDIYNTDVKSLSSKEMTLAPYLYYLKAQILQQRGFGAKVDLAKAYQNPIIALLSKGNVLANSALKVSANDVEDQYDYIRTTFGDLRVGFEYLNPDYKLVSIDSKTAIETPKSTEIQAEKTQESPVAAELAAKNTAENMTKSVSTDVQSLKESTDPIDMISADNQVSIAQMLASQSLNVVQNQNNNSPVEISDVVKTVEYAPVSETVVTEPQSEKVVQKVEPKENVVAAIEDKTVTTKESAVETEIVAEPKDQEQYNTAQVAEFDPNTIVFTAPEQKKSESFEIKYEEPKVANDATSKIENLEFDETETKPQEESQIPTEQTSTKAVASEIKDSQNFVISYNDVQKDKVAVEEKSEPIAEQKTNIEQVETKTPSTAQVEDSGTKVTESEKSVTIAKMPVSTKTEKVEPDKNGSVEQEQTAQVDIPKSTIVEKHANVDLKEFNVPNAKIPEIREDDEVVVLEPKSFIQNAENRLANESFDLNTNKITDNFAEFKQENDATSNAVAEKSPSENTSNQPEPEIISDAKVETEKVADATNATTNLVDPDKVLIENQKEDESQNEVAAGVEVEDNTLVNSNKLDVVDVEETLTTKKAKTQKVKKEKPMKVKKERTLDDILTQDTETQKVKPAKVKKEKRLKDVLSENVEQPTIDDKISEDKNELKEFLNDNQSVSQTEQVETKKSRKDRKKSKHQESVESILRSVGLTPQAAETIVETEEQATPPAVSVIDDSENIDNKGNKLSTEKKSLFGFFKRNRNTYLPEEEIITKDISGKAEIIDVPQEPVEVPVQNVEQKTEKVKKSWFEKFKKSRIEKNSIEEEKLTKAPEAEVIEDIEENSDNNVKEVVSSPKKTEKAQKNKVDKNIQDGITTLPEHFEVFMTDEDKKELEKGDLKSTPVIKMGEDESSQNVVEQQNEKTTVESKSKKDKVQKEVKPKAQKEKKLFSFKNLFKRKDKSSK